MNRTTSWAVLVVACLLDNILTYYLLESGRFRELNPLMQLALTIPFGLFVSKSMVLGALIAFRRRVSTAMLRFLAVGMSCVVAHNLLMLRYL